MSRPALIVCDCERCADAFDDQIDEAVREARAFLPVGAGDEVIAERDLASTVTSLSPSSSSASSTCRVLPATKGQMDVQTTSEVVTTTTKIHKAVFSADEIKNVALLTAKDKADVADSIDSSNVVISDDGSITVVIVETIRETSGEGGDTAYEKAEETAKSNAAEMDSSPRSQAPVISVSNLGG